MRLVGKVTVCCRICKEQQFYYFFLIIYEGLMLIIKPWKMCGFAWNVHNTALAKRNVKCDTNL